MLVIKNIWVLFYLILMFTSTFIHIAKDGTPQGNYSAGAGIVSLLISLILLYNAGLFE